ncbi:MAG: hypothetical protein ACM3JJ_10300 [Hyphomicrobiales bacterium]
MDLRSTHRWIAVGAAAALALFAPAAGFGAGGSGGGTGDASAAPSDSGYTLKGGAERTDLKSLTVEGEDRIHVDIERPTLTLDLKPEAIAGLDFGTAAEVLNRTSPDLTTAYLASTADARSPYTGRPWLTQFATGSVARFAPDVKGSERWKLTVADSHGETVAQFSGKGDPPKEITWDGRSVTGEPVMPGITYSYVFEAVDKAGNKRNFVGQGFRVSAYRLDGTTGTVLVFSGQSLHDDPGAGATSYGQASAASQGTPAILLEAASILNQSTRVSQPIRVTASARSYEQANSLAKQVSGALSDLTLGDPTRVVPVAQVVPDAPDGGTVRIALGEATTTPVGTPAGLRGGSKSERSASTAKKGSKSKK